ncbi:MAG: FtsX-like permease family protein [Chloroflexi bacterium]|nr:FtsX-like permease family protein [Chloroflexota bacterium]MYF78769.1 FtsX-like permease family protein [Chloroflexota bacterium]MYK60396.1 FtsX-like permease family protein [Chloroflexota bacterium]
MSPLDIIRTSIYSLTANRLRAALALLGIVLGVCSVITLMSIGRGSTDRITELIQGLGSNLLTVIPSGDPLTLTDVDALRDPLYTPSIKAVAPQIGTFGTIHIDNNTTQAAITGVTPEFLNVRNLEMGTGTFIGTPHVESLSEVVVLGAQVSEDLFGNQDPTGAEVRINGRQFRVVGVLASQTGFGSLDDQALIPITTAYYRLSGQRTPGGDISVDQISVQARDVESVDQAIEEIETVLRLSHRITDADDFTVFNQQEILDTFEETNQTLVVFLGTVAGISLLVGGIGIMNIMLVSVTERTREIGIRQAMGAKRRDIVAQFVTEAVFLTFGGGIIGVIAGLTLATAIDGRFLIGTEWSTRVTSNIPVIALIVSIAVGLFFGIYPAVRAARLNPIEALRYE